MKDYYQILGVNKTATASEIRRAYRRLAFQYHPDRNTDPIAEKIFLDIKEAYEILGHAIKRVDYDRQIIYGWRDLLVVPQEKSQDDPKYRRRRPAKYGPAPAKMTESQLMAKYLPYFKWLNWVALVIIFLLIVDFVLPQISSTEKIVNHYKVVGRRTSYDLLITNTGRKIKLYENDIVFFEYEDEIIVRYTPIFKTLMVVNDITQSWALKKGVIYGPSFLLPFLLLITSGLGIFYRKNIAYSFNLSICSGVLIICVIALIILL